MKKTTDKIFEEVDRLLSQRLVSASLDRLDNVVLAYPLLSAYRQRLEELRSGYGYMRDYALQGLPDPTLEASLGRTLSEIGALRDEMERDILSVDAPTLYYNVLRVRRATDADTIPALVGEYTRVARRLSMAELAENAREAQAELAVRAEKIEVSLFNALWTTHPLTSGDVETLGALMDDLSISVETKALVLSAITMGGLEWADDRRLRLLMDVYASTCAEGRAPSPLLAARALTGLLLLLSAHRKRELDPRVANRLAALRDMDSWRRDVSTVSMLFVRSRDTERLTRKFDEELMPEMMKMRPEIEKMRQNPISGEELELNPEWAEALSNSGLGDRLRELQELQEEGGDVMMATFRNLKSFPFFNDMANWFRPFRADHSALRGHGAEGGALRPLIEVLASAQGLCDSDKYSIALSLANVPEAQRQMISSQLKMQADAMTMAAAASASESGSMAEAATSYVRSIYRFFKLFRRKGEFADPFTGGLELISTPVLAPEYGDRAFLEVIAEFYFSKGYWEDAVTVYTILNTSSAELSATACQKLAFCYQSLGHYEPATAYYTRADSLDPDNAWTLGRLGRCYQRLKMWKAAAEVYHRLEKLRPDDTSIALNLGLTLLEQGQAAEALNYLHKAEFYAPGSEKAIRALARCTLALGDYDNCTRYTLSLLTSTSARPDDYLLAGHMALVTGHPEEAVDHYVDAIKIGSIPREQFLHTLDTDYRSLNPTAESAAGALLSIVADTALRRAASGGV